MLSGSHAHPGSDLLSAELVLEASDNVSSLQPLHFFRRVELDEVFNLQIATTDLDQDLVALLYLDVDLLLAELVDTFRLSKEQNLEGVLLRVLAQELTKDLVGGIICLRVVDLASNRVFPCPHPVDFR